MKQGEIWLVKYPDGVGHEYFKERPALVIESDQQILRSNIFSVMAITSNTGNCLEEDIAIDPDSQNHLWLNSIIKVHHIQSFDLSRFLKKIGKVSESLMSQVKDYIKVHFAV